MFLWLKAAVPSLFRRSISQPGMVSIGTTGISTRKPVVENEVFGHHAAIGCHMSNYSYFNKKEAVWDPATKDIKA